MMVMKRISEDDIEMLGKIRVLVGESYDSVVRVIDSIMSLMQYGPHPTKRSERRWIG